MIMWAEIKLKFLSRRIQDNHRGGVLRVICNTNGSKSWITNSTSLTSITVVMTDDYKLTTEEIVHI